MERKEIYNSLKNQRYKFYESPEKIFVDAYPQGTGKTWTSHAWVMNNNNNISFFNTHEAIDEIYYNISRFDRLDCQLKNYLPNINVLFGKSFILTEKQQRIYLYPPCLCNLHTNKYLFNLRNKGFLISNYCKEKCPDRNNCLYKQHKQEVLRAYKIKNMNNLCMMPKSFIYTGIIDSFINKFENLIVIFEESLFNIAYIEKVFYPSKIRRYIELINSLFSSDNSLEEIWKPLEEIYLLVQNYIIGKKNIKQERKVKEIVEEINNFINSLGKHPLIKLEEWNSGINNILFNYRRSDIEKVQNITFNTLIPIIEDFIKKQKANENVNKCFIVSEIDNKISYVINKIDLIKQLINGSKKFIINDATGIKKMYEIMLPEFMDDIEFFKKDIQAPWKQVYTFNKYWAQKATYPKYSLVRKYPDKNTKEKYKQPFYNLIEVVKEIFKFEYDRGREKALILGFKILIKDLKKALDSLIQELNLDVLWEYWYNLEGKNSYKECEYGVSFGSPGWSKQVIQMYNDMFGIPKNILRQFSTKDQLIQGMGRLRPLIYKNEKIWYNLTNIMAGQFINEIDLELQLKYKNLFKYMKQMGWSTQERLATFHKTSTTSIGKILEKLEKDGLVKTRRIGSGRGQRLIVYKYVGIN